VVGWVVLPLMFDLSQALCLPGGFPGLQEVSCCTGVILCDSRVFCVVFEYFGSVRVDTL